MAEHTPGNWGVDQDNPCWIYADFAENDELVRVCMMDEFEYGVLPRDECEANARLVAAAPDLLAFAKAFEDSGMDSVGGIDVHELISKATNGV